MRNLFLVGHSVVLSSAADSFNCESLTPTSIMTTPTDISVDDGVLAVGATCNEAADQCLLPVHMHAGNCCWQVSLLCHQCCALCKAGHDSRKAGVLRYHWLREPLAGMHLNDRNH